MEDIQRVMLLALSLDDVALLRQAVGAMLSEGRPASRPESLEQRCRNLLDRLPSTAPSSSEARAER